MAMVANVQIESGMREVAWGSGDLVVLLLGGFAGDGECDYDYDGDGDDDDDKDEAPVRVDLAPEIPQVFLSPTYPDCYLLRVVSVSFISS